MGDAGFISSAIEHYRAVYSTLHYIMYLVALQSVMVSSIGVLVHYSTL